MADVEGGTSTGSAPGFLHSVKSALAVLSSILHTRLELFATELEEERERLKQTLVLILLVFFSLSFGLILFTIFLVALFWDNGWIAAIGCLAGVYLGVGLIAALKLRSAFLTRPGLFPATLAELGKDRDQIEGFAPWVIGSKKVSQRKQSLIEKAARERAELAAAYDKIRAPFDIGGTLIGIGRTLKTHPLIAAGISSFLVTGYAAKLLKSAGEMLKLWRLARPLWSWWTTRRKAK